MNTYITSREELERIIDQSIKKSIENSVPGIIRRATSKEFLTKDELIKLTGWSSRSLQNLRSTRQIPFSQHGKKILYPYDGILEFLESNHNKPRI